MIFYSPLRYPGGKNKLAPFIAKICSDNNISGHYVEPYAGGASVALFLLFEGFVKRITINDKDRSIYAVWHSILKKSEELIDLIEKVDLNVDNWRKMREIQHYKNDVDLLTLGFSTMFSNRTNRSGIIRSGLIGGIEQNGKYKMSCRFNKEDIIFRIRRIAKLKSKITLSCNDALALIEHVKKESNRSDTIFYFDPPYFNKASSLYMNHYNHSDHEIVSEMIKNLDSINWIVSYDNVPEIRALYEGIENIPYSFKHTAYKAREGKEILFFSKNLDFPNQKDINPVKYRYRPNREHKFIYRDK